MNKKKIIIYMIVFLIILLGLIFVYLYRINKQDKESKNTEIENNIEKNNDNFDMDSINIELPKISEIPEEARNYIKNYNDFVYNIKQFIYLNNLQNITVAKYKDYKVINKYRVYIFLELNSKDLDEIGVIIDNTTESKIYVSYQKEMSSFEYASLQVNENGDLVYPDGVSVDGINFSIENIPEEVIKYFSEFNSYLSGFKSYVFMHGLNKNATIATFQSYEYNKHKKEITMYFYLNDTNKTKITTIFNN